MNFSLTGGGGGSVSNSLANIVRYALDPAAWAREVLGDDLDPWQAGVLSGPHRKVALNCHRQAGKSRTLAHAAAHMAAHVPGSVTIIISKRQGQAELLLIKAEEMLKRTGLVVAPTIYPDPGIRVVGGGDIVALASAPSGTRGYTADLLIVDEASHVPDDLYHSVTPFLSTRNGRQLIASTPFGKLGFFWEVCEGNTKRPAPGWHVVKLNVRECSRISADFLAEELRAKGRWWFAQEYENEFVDTEGAVFSQAHIQRSMSDSVEEIDL
jgi:hypothetical protein